MKLLILLISLTINAQDRVSISVFQDVKFLIQGDEKREIKKGTINILSRINMQGKQQRYGYMVISMEGEYADLRYKYYRYSASIGYTFNKFIKNIEANISGGWGWINRGMTYHSGAISGALMYKLTSWVKIGVLGQLTDRTDIGVKRFSGFFGTEITF